MSQIKWLPEALADIERLHAFLSEKNPQAMARAIRVILDGANQLVETPRLGRLMPDESERRELFLPFAAAAYVLRYRLDGENPVIIRVWHCRENWR